MRFRHWPIGFWQLLSDSAIPATIAIIQDKGRNPNSFVEICQNRWNPAILARSRPVGRDLAVLARSGRPTVLGWFVRPAGRNPAFLARIRSSESGVTGFWRRWPDSGNIDRMLSDFSTGKISMMVDCLKWRSTVSFNRGWMRLTSSENDLRF